MKNKEQKSFAFEILTDLKRKNIILSCVAFFELIIIIFILVIK